MRGISRSTEGAMRRATALYRARGGGTAAQRAYTRGANTSLRAGRGGMAAHRAGLRSAGLS